jgi:hypothetical protein
MPSFRARLRHDPAMRRAANAGVAAILLVALFGSAPGGARAGHRTNAAIRAAFRLPARIPNGAFVPQVSGGVMATVAELRVARQGTTAPVPVTAPGPTGCGQVFRKRGRPANVRANQDCTLRRQAEEIVAANPTDPTNLVIGQNDSRTGFNQTGLDYTVDGGKRFGDFQPGTRFLSCAGVGYDAFSDPSVTFNANGATYYAAVGFDLGDATSGLFVWKADVMSKGSYLHDPADRLDASPSRVAENCNETAGPGRGTDFQLDNDRESIVADSSAVSPFANNVYVTWTIFDFHCGSTGQDYCSSAIFFSRSLDGGVSWSQPKEISGSNADICAFGDTFDPARGPSDCDFDQDSAPFVDRNGDLYVAFNNCNTTTRSVHGLPGQCQQLVVTSNDAGVTWTAPVRAAVDVATEPINFSPLADPVTGCPPFRQCLAPNGYRLSDYPSISGAAGRLAVVWSDFRHGGPCDNSAGIITEPCDDHNADVFVSVSADAGLSWSPPRLVSSRTGRAGSRSDPAAQWQPWGAVGPDGTLYVAYYDRRYGRCERTGCNDVTLATSHDDGLSWTYRRITTGSMPNLVPANNPVQAGFLGDYLYVVVAHHMVDVVWADTRGVIASHNPTPEEDVYLARLPAR